jgi:nucleotide-binding universal stress UspA family protein
MFKSILVPVDLSETEKGKLIIGTASKLAGKDTRIRLVYIVENIPLFVASELPGDYLKASKQDAGQALKALATAAGLKPDVEVRSGSAGSAILESADSFGADLIILASHKPGLQDYLLGSTAARVVRHAPCSVLVIR